MPRPILGTPQAAKASVSPPASTTAPRSTLQGARLQQRLREKRSAAYVQAITRLDAGTHQANRSGLDALIEAIANEFPELSIEQRPIGIVSQCYLGAPYEVHICDLGGGIIEHFQIYRPMPPLFERGRSLALHPGYAFVEVYPDTLRAVSLDGAVSVITSESKGAGGSSDGRPGPSCLIPFELITPDECERRLQLLPPTLRRAIESEANLRVANEVCKKHGIVDKEKMLIVEQIVGVVMLGFLHYSNVAREIDEHVGGDRLGQQVAAELEARIFVPVKSDLEKIQRRL